MGRVDVPPEFLNTLTVQLQTKGKEETEEYALGPSNVFVFPGLDVEGTYIITLQVRKCFFYVTQQL